MRLNHLFAIIQGCLLSESECDTNSCSNLNDENTSLRNDAFQETLVPDDMTHPGLERNISNILVPDILTGDKTVRELEGLGHLRLDTCCFADPRSNCDDRTFYQPDHLSKPNCITNQGNNLLFYRIVTFLGSILICNWK